MAAAEQAQLELVPAVELHALFTAAGLDLDEICDTYDLGLLTNCLEILDHLPNALRETYALDDIC